MLLNFTFQELERVECDIKAYIKNKDRAKQESETLKFEMEDIQVPCNILICIVSVPFLYYCFSRDKIEQGYIYILAILLFLFILVNSLAQKNSSCDEEKNFSQKLSNKNIDFPDEDERFSDENIKREILKRLKAQYFCESNINFLNFLYHKDILLRAEKDRIDDFLAQKGKTILDYLSALGEKELEIFAKPYKEQITIDIEEAVHNYYEDKSKQEKSLLELVKAQA